LKVPLAVPVILEEVERHGKVLVLVQHIGSVLEPLLGLLTDAYGEGAVLCVHGGIASAARSEVETRFNEWPSVKVCIVQTRAGGVGLNLQKSCHRVIELEADWSGQSNRQGWARVHRWGQTHPVHVSRLTLAGTIDDACLAISEHKVSDAANIITPTEKL
jgi:SNF2 family DNA or RNA helicase